MSSQVEGYITVMQEQELNIKDAMKRKEKNSEKKGRLDMTTPVDFARKVQKRFFNK